jgi:hypothetical protein
MHSIKGDKTMKSAVLRMLILLIVGTVLLSAGSAALAQMGPPAGTCEVLSGEDSLTIPVVVKGTYVVITAEINGQEIGLILDTGMPVHGVLLHEGPGGDTYGLEYASKAPIMGAGGGQVEADLAMGVQIKLPGLVLKDQMAIVMPYALDRYMVFIREGLHGVIGLSLFDRFVVTIDYDKSVIVLTKPESYSPPSDAEMLPITLRRNVPFLSCSAQMPDGSTVPMNLVVDCGHARSLALNVGSQESIVPPADALHGRIGIGATGEILGHVGRIPKLKIGSYTFENIVASFLSGPRTGPASIEEEGNLGAEILRRFRVAFDYENERMIFEPGRSMVDPFEHDMSGLEVSRLEDGSFTVDRITPASAAEHGRLGSGDIIVEILGRPAGEVSLIEFREMMKQEGEKVALGVIHEGKKRTVTLTLKRQI